MALNAQYEEIGMSFVEKFYNIFDDPTKRTGLVYFYSPTDSLMTFEGQQIQGTAKIGEKVQTFGFQKIKHNLTTIDSQPLHDGGVLVTVTGRLQCDEDSPLPFSQVFVLKANEGANYFVTHDIFRLTLHNTPWRRRDSWQLLTTNSKTRATKQGTTEIWICFIMFYVFTL